MGENKRILYLDYARVFTALLVIYGHLYTPSDSNWVRILIYQFHMPLFFIISGMLHKYTGAIQWKKYFRTIVIPTAFFVFLYAIITFPLYKWAGWFGFKESVPKTLFDGCTTIQSVFNYLKYYAVAIVHGTNMLNGPCWFLIALLWCKIFTDLFNKSTTTKIVATVIWALAFLCVITFHKKAFFLGQATIAIPYYILGYISKDKIYDILSSKAKTPLFIISTILLLSCAYLNNKTSMFAIGFGRMPFPVNFLMFYIAG